ncbi:hypothetical protein G4B88_030908 [Cannabis sativa]|uniref:Uncharacterized protein n=1 Tax=Cannabis sativa TaxID=3483 RepID=A0A7J6DXN2_CANSA|nr:hypothetical protein G4B88_030908 [Cannabis sativa]
MLSLGKWLEEGKEKVMIRPSSKVSIKFLIAMKKHEFEALLEFMLSLGKWLEEGKEKVMIRPSSKVSIKFLIAMKKHVELKAQTNVGLLVLIVILALKEVEGWNASLFSHAGLIDKGLEIFISAESEHFLKLKMELIFWDEQGV